MNGNEKPSNDVKDFILLQHVAYSSQRECDKLLWLATPGYARQKRQGRESERDRER
jgi:hypothetical protein